MPKTLITRGAVTFVLALPVGAVAQDTLALKLQQNFLLSETSDEARPLFMEADVMRGHSEREAEAEGNVRLRRRGLLIMADEMRYDAAADEVFATGKVYMEQEGNVVEGIRLRYNLSTERGFLDKAVFDLVPPAPAPVPTDTSPGDPNRFIQRLSPSYSRGNAERFVFDGPQLYRGEQANYTTCGPGSEDWWLRTRDLEIDVANNRGIARDAKLEFLDHTIFYTPYVSFPLHRQRKSGLLTPHYGTTNTSGIELTVPYYWNIAPNYDATFYPREMARRGLQLGTEFRYMEPSFFGEARAEYLPSDRLAHRDRWAAGLRHTQALPYGWSASMNVHRVSDARYYSDLSTLVALTATTTLSADATLARGGVWGTGGTYSLTGFAQKWQTLQTDPDAPIRPPYDRLPQLTLTAFHPDVYGADIDMLTSYVDFQHPSLVRAKRILTYPTLSIPIQNPYAYIIPKLGVHATQYIVEANSQGFDTRARVLPIASVEAGFVMERDTSMFGMPFTQTLEPKLFYVYIPYREQNRLPNFESGLQDVSFATMFTENQFSGHDRVNDANLVTAGVISRFIRQEDGSERLRIALAQRYYFEEQRVTLPDQLRQEPRRSSDILAAISGTILPNWTLEGGLQFNAHESATQKFNVATRYQPDYGKVVNLAYRETRDLIRQADVSFQWPVASNWSVVGRWNWSIQDRRLLEGLAGFEYDGGCWALRAVVHRFQTSLSNVSKSFFLQLELNGLSRVGSNPLDALRRNVGGYTRIDPRAARVDNNGPYFGPGRY